MFIFIDSAVTGCNIAIAGNNGIMAMHQEPITRGHAEFLMPQFQMMMNACGKTPNDIDEIFVTVGPGSFTGLRVGITAAQMMGYALEKPVHGITSFQTFSVAVTRDAAQMVVVDTKRDDYYVQIMGANNEPLSKPRCLLPDAIQGLLQDGMVITGDAVTKLSNDIDLSHVETVQQDMIDLQTVTNALIDKKLNLIKPEAFYIRDADVSKPKATTR